MKTQFAILLTATCLFYPAQGWSANDHWVATWATAQQLVRLPPGGRGGPPPQTQQAPSTQQGAATPTPPRNPQAADGRGRGGPQSNIPPTLDDQTIRMVVHTSIGGRRVRVQLSNAVGATALTIGAAHIAVRAKDSEIVPATDRALTFAGKPGCTIQPGVLIVQRSGGSGGRAPVRPCGFRLPPQRYWAADKPHGGSAYGLHFQRRYDGTAGHAGTQHDVRLPVAFRCGRSRAARRFRDRCFWRFDYRRLCHHAGREPRLAALLAKRMAANKATAHIAVVNQGISGNQVLRDGAGRQRARPVRARCVEPRRREVDDPAGRDQRYQHPRPELRIRSLTSDELIAGYRQLIDRAHTHGIRVIGATIMPEEGVPTASERGEEIRLSVNQWIRTSHAFDAVVDFDAVVRDPEHPGKLRAAFDPGDHIHPNDAGNQAMADAFDLAIFKK